MVSEVDAHFLLTLARHSIEHALSTGELARVSESEVPAGPCLSPCGCFVTLHTREEHELRGCIGIIEANTPLFRNIIHYATLAATEDPRFPSVTLDELPSLQIEISILSPITQVTSIDAIQVGVHGLIVKRGSRQGLLLPQVPVEWGWDRDEFLAHTCLKAHLPKTAYQDEGTELFWFTAHVISES